MTALRVLVVDDSAVARESLTALLSRHGGMDVTTAADGVIALRKLARERPDVIVLDLDLPRLSGLDFLSQVMRNDPIPVVVCSSLGDGRAALDALERGALEVIAKPRLGVRDFLLDSAITIVDCVRAAATARVPVRLASAARRAKASLRPRTNGTPRIACEGLVALGASTGGTEALAQVLERMPADAPGMVVVQHMPAPFTAAFANRLDQACAVRVRQAGHGDRVEQGLVLIAPGDRHLRVRGSPLGFAIELDDGPLVSRHRPSVDVLFESVAKAAGTRAVGVIMTGMGSDGASGLFEMRAAGAATIAQDEKSSAVFGMARHAIERGAAETVMALAEIGDAILRASSKWRTR